MLGKCINSFHMPMFFIVAGYFSKPFHSWGDALLCIKKYARRLLPAFVFTQVGIILWTMIMAMTKGEGWNPVMQQALSLLWADPFGPDTPWGRLTIGVIWFLMALFIGKSVLLILSQLGRWAIPISLLISLGTILIHRVFPYSIWGISLGLTALPFLVVGWWVKTHRIPIWIILVSIVFWIIAIFFSELVMYDMKWGCYPVDFLGACGGTFCLYYISKLINKCFDPLPQAFAILGCWSLAIMCFHDLEMHCHLGNHVMALLPVSFPLWGEFLFRYLLTIGLASTVVNLPVIKKLFV